ncbi:MAG TPA: hypothetical protein VMW23_01120, partial [Sedimentisphaerales bacterium]|nr:hypothetical protein [Sedimentisphaerales bacterium]
RIDMYADDSITLGDTVLAAGDIYLSGDEYDYDQDHGLVWAKSSITTTDSTLDIYGEDIQVDGPINTADSIYMYADDSITLGGSVIADGDISLYADEEDYGQGYGLMWAKSSITTTNSDLYVEGENIEIDGPVDIAGRIDMYADDSITLVKTAKAAGDIWLEADYDGVEGGSVDVHGLLAGDNIDILASDTTINIHKSADPLATADVEAGGDVVLHNNAWTEAGVIVKAGDDVTALGTVTGAGDLTIEAGVIGDGSAGAWANVLLDKWVTVDGDLVINAGDDITANGKLTSNNVVSSGNMTLKAGDDIYLNATPESAQSAGLMQIEADLDSLNGTGNVDVAGSLEGNMTLSGTNVYVDGTVTSFGTLDVDADENISLKSNVSSVAEMTMDAGDNITLNEDSGNTSSESTIALIAGGDITIGAAYTDEGDVTANGNMEIWAGDGWNDDVIVYGKLTTTNSGDIDVRAGDDIYIYGTGDDPYESVEADGALTMSSNTSGIGIFGGNLYIAGDAIAASMQLEAGTAGPPDYSDSHVRVDGSLQTTSGDMVIEAHHDILLGGNVDSAGNLVLNADRHGDYGYPDPHVYGGDVEVAGTVDAVGTIDMFGNNITLENDVTSGGDMTLTADTSSDFEDPLPEGDVTAMGNLTSTGGSISIYSSDDTTYLGSDVTAFVDVLLNNNTEFTSTDDQRVTAQTGSITANGWLHKGDSSLYVKAAEDISLAGSVAADSGGVSIIAENGKIFTPDEFGDPTDTLNVSITGRSDDEAGTGVDLPYGPGKAAIVIMSAEDLKLGPQAELRANGIYDTTGIVDDRQGVKFLDVEDTVIGAVPRKAGDPFDAAIYLASTAGDVDVSSPVSIVSEPAQVPNGDTQPIGEPKGAMVIDAYDTVTFDGGRLQGDGDTFFQDSLEGDEYYGSYVGNRLEVASRITEWLYQAVGRLPYVGGGGPFPAGYTYVLRGAGLENAGITDGRAWVLEDPTQPAPLYREAGETTERQTLGTDGCPALIAAAAAELGIPEEDIQVSLANSFALDTDIQPCETCARVLNAAAILRDEDGSRMAAMNQVFNELAPAEAPFTPEMATSIVTAFAGHVNDGTQYATAIEYIDAFIEYVAVLGSQMGSPVGDPIAFVMDKYGTTLAEGENDNILAFVAMRMESMEALGY